jgi:hypothetical protein
MKSVTLRAELSALMLKHGVRAAPPELPWLATMATPLEIEGAASTPDLDLGRMIMMPRAFGSDLPRVPLHYRHDERRTVGRIRDLSYAPDGSLHVRAEVTDALAARCPALSIGAQVVEYTLHDTDTPWFYAKVHRAILREISLTPEPANRQALVTKRWHPTAQYRTLDVVQQRVERLRAQLKELAYA